MTDPRYAASRRFPSRRTLIAGAAAGSALALAGAPVAVASAPRQKVRLVFHPQLLPLFARENEDIFAKPLAQQGVDVEWVDVQGSHSPAIAAVLGGSADVTFGGTTAVALTSAANGQEIAIVAIGKTIKTNGGIVVYPDSGITKVADLRGKTVAVNRGGFGELTLVKALEKNGIPRDSVKFVFLSLNDGRVAFAAKKVDAYVALAMGTQIATIVYGGKIIFDVDKDLTEEESVIAGNTLSFVTTQKFAGSHKESLRKVFEAYKNVVAWVNANLDKAFELADKANKYPSNIRAAVREQSVGYALQFPVADKDVSDLQKSADFLLANKVLPRAVDVRKYVIRY